MPLTNTDKLKIFLVLLLLAIPVWMTTSFGVNTMRSWGVGGSKLWMDMTILVSRSTLRTEEAAYYMREKYVIWPNEKNAARGIYTAADSLYNIGRTAEKVVQNRTLTRCWDIYKRLKEAQEADGEFTVERGEGQEPLRYKVSGLTGEQKTKMDQNMDWMRDWHNRYMGGMQDDEWDWTLYERYKYKDGWDPKKIK